MSLADQLEIYKEMWAEERGYDQGYQQGFEDGREPPEPPVATVEKEDPIERLGDTIAKLDIVEAKQLDEYLRNKGINLIGLA